jgi:hypothetical protein
MVGKSSMNERLGFDGDDFFVALGPKVMCRRY